MFSAKLSITPTISLQKRIAVNKSSSGSLQHGKVRRSEASSRLYGLGTPPEELLLWPSAERLPKGYSCRDKIDKQGNAQKANKECRKGEQRNASKKQHHKILTRLKRHQILSPNTEMRQFTSSTKNVAKIDAKNGGKMLHQEFAPKKQIFALTKKCLTIIPMQLRGRVNDGKLPVWGSRAPMGITDINEMSYR